MRAIIILAVIILLMGLVGWLTFGHSPGRTSINIETDEIQRDTKSAVENTERMIESGARVLTGDEELDEQPVEVSPPVEPAPADTTTAEQEPVRTSPTESPVTSPVVVP